MSTSAPAASTSSGRPASVTWWPPASIQPTTFEPSSRSSKRATTRAIALLAAQPAELLADRLGPAPHLRDLDAARAQLAQRELAADALVVEELQRAVHRRGGGGVAELVRDEDPPVPVVVRVGLRVDLGDDRRGVDVAVLLHAQVELEVGPVRRQRVEDRVEVLREGAHPRHHREHVRRARLRGGSPRARARAVPPRPARPPGAARRRRGGRRRARRAGRRGLPGGGRRGGPAGGRAPAAAHPRLLR
ncbi:MAG: hypothetical protein AVDCRST_MAG30-759 [uncultured Solirubrobacteraceae bacterium]|uniref:Uncharacterized protein n=1 Tax=uncultured Solirubrobacteraceae bacterium TaxID=1162706 RepID=A0A6J4RS90_9ACTN|nr:MAG: hypothetical protein AVDCRST_MAG30-759 [uncultured Solirubrobacteraceae bacterium]